VAGFYAYLLARGDTSVSRNPVPRGLVTRRERKGRRQGANSSMWFARSNSSCACSTAKETTNPETV
jgi:hypothetical protein